MELEFHDDYITVCLPNKDYQIAHNKDNLKALRSYSESSEEDFISFLERENSWYGYMQESYLQSDRDDEL